MSSQKVDFSKQIFDVASGKFIDTPEEVTAFLDDIQDVCRKYNLSIAHEDTHGGFIIEHYKACNIAWLREASKGY
jgi:hypothetical protein